MTQKLLADMIALQFYGPKPPSGPEFRKTIFTVVTNTKFDLFIISCICLNTIFMMMDNFGIDDDWAFVLEVGNFIFAMVFNVECVLKLLALDWNYFYILVGHDHVYQNWNIFDFVVVLGTNVGMI